ncbi:aminotransferase class V-fold PLP-dependent enzyme [Bacillus aerolatus]|uniref:O-succinylhomoserine sulfhydrylase n=1 Tax=Bacillus aerolatus TaxID=2653354 RepID=A0A6I1FGZ3_9BACI|nr:aminotransferase class V-fold PLP-dependent enzyme [Bacillus aerolatus]
MTAEERNRKFETNTVHGGQIPDPVTGSRAVPIYQTTSYVFQSTDHAKKLFSLEEEGNIYSRMSNPTVDVFEKRMALLEKGTGAVATSSGQAAITLALLTLASAGDEIVSASNIYGGTYNLFASTFANYGITVKFVDGTNPENFKAAITDKTKAVFAETIGNPSLHILDTEAVANIAHDNGIPLVIDNTFATPFVNRPIEYDADIVVHSATKWIGGHGNAIAGVIIDSGTFDWNNPRFPQFTEPDKSYHGVRFAEDFGDKGYITKVRAQLLRDFGSSLSPFNAFLLLQGLESLHVRVERHNENAAKLAEYLEKHPAVSWVTYPGLPSHPSHERAKEVLENGFGSVLVFGAKGGRQAAENVIDQVKLWSHLANVGDAKSLIIHPASTTHQQLSDEELKATGVTEELIRLSVGLEAIDDLIEDLDQALQKAEKQQKAPSFA